MENYIIENAKKWLTDDYDIETRKAVQKLLDEKSTELTDAFYKDLEFGTGGLRGIMGVGSNRMNQYTVGMATQGLANHLLKKYPNQSISVAIAYDCRNNNTYFEGITSNVLTANGIKVYRFDALRPTPELSFAVRQLKCQSGIVITASHNPKEYNGYKVYGADGGQLISPEDNTVIEEVRKISSVREVKFNGNPKLVELISNDLDEQYIAKIKSISLNPEIIDQHHDIKMVYTPIHGTGVNLVPQALKSFGFSQVIGVDSQNVVDGNFPTVHSPNPEESAALELAIAQAKATGANLVMATDPDADRVGIAFRNKQNEFVLLNGNQTASILFYYVLDQWKQRGKLTGNEFIVKTIVTTELLANMAQQYGVKHYDVLTGFKYIAQIIREQEGSQKFIIGGEESYGYLVGDAVRDKDAVASCCFIAETYAWATHHGKDFEDLLIEIYQKFGFYLESLKSVTKKGKSGADEIIQMMEEVRNNPPKTIAGSKVKYIKDYQLQKVTQLFDGSSSPLDLPKSDVIQLLTEDESIITMRPSGTEPKIKFYFGVKSSLSNAADFEKTKSKLQGKIEAIISDLKL